MKSVMWIILFSLLSSICFATVCARPYSVSFQHIEGEGLGYKKGYSSLDLFLSDSHTCLTPLLDLRGHVFNDGKWASNSGIGLRGNWCERVWGVNGFYDYRLTSKRPFHQIGIGLELFLPCWDFRANGYLPISHKESRPYDFQFNLNNFELSAKRELAMKGFDAEAAYHFYKIFTALGPYYYTPSKYGNSTFGGRFRTGFNWKWFSIEGILTYDHLFKWIPQGRVGLNFPFGPRADPKEKTGPIYRQEIIVIEKHRNRF